MLHPPMLHPPMLQPLLLAYIIINYRAMLVYRWASILVVMFLVLAFPKVATCTRANVKFVLVETLASFLQFTPEALVGCVRIVRAIQVSLSVCLSVCLSFCLSVCVSVC